MPQTELIGGTNMVARQKPVRGPIRQKSRRRKTSEGIVQKNNTKGKVRKEKRGHCRERLERREIRIICTYIYRGLESSCEANWRGTCAGIPPTVCGVGWDSVYVGEHLERDVRFFVRWFLCGQTLWCFVVLCRALFVAAPLLKLFQIF